MEQPALGALAGDDHRARVAALERALPEVQAQATLLLRGPVT